MTSPEYNWFQAIPAGQFDSADLTSDWQPVFADGFLESIKIMTVFNGSDVAMDVSFDGTNLHSVWPSGATLVIDFQTNHKNNSESGAGTLVGKQGQNVWVRTSVQPDYLTVGGFR